MTIGKIRYRLLLLCALLGILGGALSSCQLFETQEPPFELLMTETEEETLPPVSEYTILVRSDCSAELYSEAKDFAEAITQRTGVSADVYYDNEEGIYEEGGSVILVGLVDHPLAKDEMKNLRRDDYRCRAEGNTVILGGRNDTATLAALARFCQELLPHATAQCLMNPEGGFSFTGEYSIRSVQLNGFDLYEYTIVYPNSASESLREMAHALRDRLAESSGYDLTVCSKKEYGDVGKGIFLSLEPPYEGSGLSYMIPEKQGVSLCAEELFGLSVAGRDFCELLLSENTNGECKLSLSATRTVRYEDPEYRIASIAADHLLPFSAPADVSAVLSPVLTNEPRIAFFGSVPEEQKHYLTEHLQEYRLVSGSTLPVYEQDAECSVFGQTESAVYRVGDEKNGFLLAYLRGTVSPEEMVSLLEEIGNSKLPVVILVHASDSVGEPSLLEATELGIATVFREDYQTVAGQYSFSCYATERAFSIAKGQVVSSAGYVDLTIERRSVL